MKQIGFEYEGFINVKKERRKVRGDYAIYDDILNKFGKSQNKEVFKTIYSSLSKKSLYEEILNNYSVYDAGYRDGYIGLAELRFFSVPLDSDPNIFVNNLYELAESVFQKGSVEWKELEVAEGVHEYSLEELEKHRNSRTFEIRQENRNLIGEFLDYNLKTPLTVNNSEVHQVIPWAHEELSKWRGGGLHINISPIEPKDVLSFITKLHEELFSINDLFNFNSNYRKQLLFRYREYDGVPGVEYMSLGLDLSKVSKKEVEAIFKKIFDTVRELL